MCKKLFLVSLIFVFSGCKNKLDLSYIESINDTIPQPIFSNGQLKSWYFKDIVLDSLPGLSLYRAYDSIIPKLRKSKEVIVAIIDMPLDISHEDLKENIWENYNEIPNNRVDDDGNGYVDDIHGWNFIASKDGKTSKFVKYEYTRIIEDYEKDSISLSKDTLKTAEYKRALDKYKSRYSFATKDTTQLNWMWRDYKKAVEVLSKYVDKENFHSEKLDSLKKLYPSDSILLYHINDLEYFNKYKITKKYLINNKYKAKERIDKLLNKNYNEREAIGDNINDINDKSYGSPIISTYNGFFDHGTKVAGLIAANRNNGIGAQGISDDIQIMSLCVSAFGDEHDKDIALAIRYAVDNGAKVINMSFGKEFSLRQDWVFDAIKYAEEKDVLLVTSAGNNGKDLKDFYVFPNDNDYINEEVSDNFIMVGASHFKVNSELATYYSNYGSSQVDLYAPGENMYTTIATDEKYELNPGGTSTAAAITSGVAALVRSYYPELSASQVRHILMDSGVEYTFNVKVGDTLLPFNSLSKSGKILNAYNALIMADSISRN